MARKRKPLRIPRTVEAHTVVHYYRVMLEGITHHKNAMACMEELRVTPKLTEKMHEEFVKRLERQWQTCVVELRRQFTRAKVDPVVKLLRGD